MVDDIERQSFFVVIFCFSSLFLLFFCPFHVGPTFAIDLDEFVKRDGRVINDKVGLDRNGTL